VIVVRAPASDVDLRCGGKPMVAMNDPVDASEPDPAFSEGTQLGKRYSTDDLELLCTKPGAGTLTVGEVVIGLKEAKALPASD
jgi:hypothetical protein